MNLLLMVDGAVGEQTFDYLSAAFPSDIGLVATAAENALATKARSGGFPVVTFDTTDQFIADLSRAGQAAFDLGVLAWWPKIVRQPLLSLPRRGFLNFHPSLLPHNRGKHYNFWAIVEGAPFGVTLHMIDAGVDTGPIVVQREIPYGWEDTGETLYWKAQRAIVALFQDSYPAIRQGALVPTPQAAGGSYHRASEIHDASRIELDRTYTARDLLNRLRARTFKGHPACRFSDGGASFEVRVEITPAAGA
jgi:methionyl-tRNA formyltransferase